jgi:hypothetical protein
VLELFPGTDIGSFNLTIVTLSQTTTANLTNTGHEVETERERVTKFVRIIAFKYYMVFLLSELCIHPVTGVIRL